MSAVYTYGEKDRHSQSENDQRQTNDLVRVLPEEVSTDLTELRSLLHSWGTTKPENIRYFTHDYHEGD